MVCKNCGKQFEGNYCPVCGKPVSNEDRAAFDSAKNSKPISKSSNTTSFDQNQNNTSTNNRQNDASSEDRSFNTSNDKQRKKEKTGCLPIIGILVVLFMACSII